MKKFLILSSLVAIAGLGVGIATRQDPAPQATSAAAADVTTTTTTPAAEPATTSTTARAATKAATKTTATTARQVNTPTTAPVVTTSTTRPATTTTTVAVPATTVVTVAGPAPTCTVVAEKPSVTYNDSQVIRLASNMPNTPVTVVMIYPKATANGYPQQFNHRVTTDGGGADVWSFQSTAMTAGTVTISVSISPPGRTMSNVCRTTFESKAV